MAPRLNVALLAIATLFCVALAQPTHASLEHFLSRRFIFDQAEDTTPKSPEAGNAPATEVSPSGAPSSPAPSSEPKAAPTTSSKPLQSSGTDKPPRLYPDLVSPGVAPPPPFGYNRHPGHHGPATPFLPFGPPPGAAYQPAPPVLPPTFVAPGGPPPGPEQSFASKLGQRLLNLIHGRSGNNATSVEIGNATERTSEHLEPRQALQNATILDQINKGMHSVYESISRAYNSTIQRQMELFQKTNNNSDSNPWQRHMVDFYKAMTERANKAQQSINEAVARFRNANASELTSTRSASDNGQALPVGPNQQGPMAFFANFDPFRSGHEFFNNKLQRSYTGNLHMSPPASEPEDSSSSQPETEMVGPNGGPTMQQQPGGDLTSKLRDFWNIQVKPQMDTARTTIMRTWQDMTANGALNPAAITGPNGLFGGNGAGSGAGGEGSGAGSSGINQLVDSIVKSVNLGGPEYSIIDEANGSPSGSGPSPPASGMANHMQTSLLQMQRQLNQLWNNIGQSMMSMSETLKRQQQTRSNTDSPAMTNNSTDQAKAASEKESVETSENEISAQLKDISAVQRDADQMMDAVQKEKIARIYREQQQQEKNAWAERMRSFYHDLNIDDNVNRGLMAVNEFWNKIPDHWNNIVTNVRKPQNNQMPAASSTSTTTAPSPSTSIPISP